MPPSSLSLCLLLSLAAPLRAQEAPSGALPGSFARRGDTNVSPLGDFDFTFGLQYRLIYESSNLPGPGGTTFDDARGYDYARQRLRLNLGVAPRGEDVGAFVQVEFRGGSGGTAPASSDPRDQEPTLNPFNRIDFRGLRYGYLYWQPEASDLWMAGILPLSDELGDTLFSADWDWNVGGLAYLTGNEEARTRFAFLNLVEGVGANEETTIDNDGTMLVGDWVQEAGDGFGFGLHALVLHVEENLPLGGTTEFWLGPSASMNCGEGRVSAFALLNTGDLGVGTLDPDGTVASGFTDETAESHTGQALRIEGQQPLGSVDVKLQLVYTSGDEDGDIDQRFVTPQGLFGTSGYWGYTHIFTANGPSDTNDLGLEIGNDGAGLTSLQTQAAWPLSERSTLTFAAGYFRAVEERNGSRDMGLELAGMLTTRIGGPLVLDFGLAGAELGDFFADEADTLYEVFARLQLQR
jgi:hypothetical protein